MKPMDDGPLAHNQTQDLNEKGPCSHDRVKNKENAKPTQPTIK